MTRRFATIRSAISRSLAIEHRRYGNLPREVPEMLSPKQHFGYLI